MSFMEEEKIVSKEDINWLLNGDENEQIISKLLNEKSSLSNMVLNIMRTSPKLINDHLALILINSNSFIKSKTMTDSQLQRLKELDKRYNLIYNYKNRFEK
jgi:hypothetical protein